MKYSKIKHVGNKPERKEISEERIFAEEWERVNKRQVGTDGGYGALELLLDQSGFNPLIWDKKDIIVDKITQRDAFVAATIIQWLGTGIGVNFLEVCETKIKEAHKKEREEFHRKNNLHIEGETDG